MKPKFTEYERRQIQAMMRQQMPWRENLVLGSDGIMRWSVAGEKFDGYFDVSGLMATACKRWQATAYRTIGDYDVTEKCVLRGNIQKSVDRWRYSDWIGKIIVSDCLKGKLYVIENTLPTGVQVMDLLDTIETEFKMSAQEMGELLHIVGGWSPNRWNERQRNERYNRMKAIWRMTAANVGQFSMVRKGYDIFKASGFDGHFVGFTEK